VRVEGVVDETLIVTRPNGIFKKTPPSLAAMTLVVTGSIGIDEIELPSGERRSGLLGGSCAYFAAAASFHGPVRIVAAAGDDLTREQRATLERFSIDTRGLEIRTGKKTFRWGGKYLGNMDARQSLYTELNVLGDKPASVPDAYKDSAFIFLANMNPVQQRAMLAQFPRRRLAVADTMNFWIETARDDLELLLKEVDGLVLNYDEAKQFTGKQNAVAAAKQLLELGPRFIVVKKGEHGAIVVHRDGIAALPAYPAETIVDPTGAGDSFAGGMMGFLAAHADEDPGAFGAILRALAHGTVIASFTIEDFSLDRLARLTKEELDARFQEFAAMLKVE